MPAGSQATIAGLLQREQPDVAVGSVLHFAQTGQAVVELPPDLPAPTLTTLAALCTAVDAALAGFRG
jgi:hypothetical protein